MFEIYLSANYYMLDCLEKDHSVCFRKRINFKWWTHCVAKCSKIKST